MELPSQILRGPAGVVVAVNVVGTGLIVKLVEFALAQPEVCLMETLYFPGFNNGKIVSVLKYVPSSE
jgi:hypothetical protein